MALHILNNEMTIKLNEEQAVTIIQMLNYCLDTIKPDEMDLLNTTTEEMDEAYKLFFNQYNNQVVFKID